MNTVQLMEKGKKFNTIYWGKVKITDDPTKQGRIKVELPELFGDADPKQTPWIYPLGYNSGVRLFNVPDIDTEVGIVFIGDVYTGFYGIGRYLKDDAKIFDEDYPNVYGFEDAQGNYLTINKETGQVKFHHRSGSEFILDKDGNTNAHITGTFTGKIDKDAYVEAPNTTMKTNLTVDGKLVVTGTSNLQKTATFEGIKWKTHVHHYNWTDGGGSSDSNPPKNP